MPGAWKLNPPMCLGKGMCISLNCRVYGKCNTCAREVKELHQLRDRYVDQQIRNIARDNLLAEFPPLDENADLLDFLIDWMEQAKYKNPWHPGLKSKAGSQIWRPQLHVCGLTVSGIREIYSLPSCSLPKNASTQCTIVLAAIEQVWNNLQEKTEFTCIFPPMCR